MLSHRVGRFWVAAVALFGALPVLAQGGAIAGKITGPGGQGIQGVRMQAQGSAGEIAASVLSREDGTYRLTSLAAGTYSVVATRLGYGQQRREGVAVTSGATATVDLALNEVVTELNPVVTTASRKAEKALDAPASIAVVDQLAIQERTSVTVADHIKGLAGVDVSQTGVGMSNIVARGFNNAFSGSILALQDYRFAGVPSLRVNVPILFTTTNEDIERVEVLLGPASALYGPNSANGVMHVITKSPFTSQGTTMTLDGGERSLRSRYSDAYPVNSGVYAAANNLAGRPITFTRPGATTRYRYGAVESATVFDMGFNYRLPFAGAKEVLWSINGTNVFDKGYRTMPGAPLIGRMFLTRLQYSF